MFAHITVLILCDTLQHSLKELTPTAPWLRITALFGLSRIPCPLAVVIFCATNSVYQSFHTLEIIFDLWGKYHDYLMENYKMKSEVGCPANIHQYTLCHAT